MFLSRDAMKKLGSRHRAVSVHLSVTPSVCLSVTFVYCVQTSNEILKISHIRIATPC